MKPFRPPPTVMLFVVPFAPPVLTKLTVAPWLRTSELNESVAFPEVP